MALLVGAGLLIAAVFGGLTTYTVTKAVSNAPTHESVHALVNNQLSLNENRDNQHENVQSVALMICIVLVVVIAMIMFVKFLVNRLRPRTNTIMMAAQQNAPQVHDL